jgi:uncharacterized protein with GYD domain
MAKYLVQASYTPEATKGLMKEGGSKRRAAAEAVAKAAGAKLEAFYFAFGDVDAILIVDAPDNVTIASISLAVNASGAVRAKTIALLTPEEIDQATRKVPGYTPPGQ